MGRTRSGGRAKPEANGAEAGEILTLAEAAAYLRFSEKEVEAAAVSGKLPANEIAGQWRFLKAGLRRWLLGGPSAVLPENEAWLSIAGSGKDDPDLEDIVEQAYRRRGRPITEDGSYRNFGT